MSRTTRAVKIFKAVNKVSTMDVTDWLTGKDLYEKNKDNEFVYKGKLIFGITDAKNGYAKAFIGKRKIKPLLQLMLNNQFHHIYGVGIAKDKGLHIKGGSKHNKDTGMPLARTFSVFFTEKKQYCFQIQEGPGRIDKDSGLIVMTKLEKQVQKFLNIEEALEFACEVQDYIHLVENHEYLNGRPLYTLLPEFKADQKAM